MTTTKDIINISLCRNDVIMTSSSGHCFLKENEISQSPGNNKHALRHVHFKLHKH